ncbi:MAG TPA: prepilin-type N-terminal cleavage/methylation domain-containing protein [Gemmatimonadales bacterium]|nr:prepilin-type N-terminal cleavage/methylation domain-containing protein [Gemmatimonadales bacterium]
MMRMRAQAQRGFTLIELLIVVVIIGILAAIAIPKYGHTKAKAHVAAMTSDLRNLATIQESFFADSNYYYGGAIPATGFAMVPSQEVTLTVQNVTGSGWGALATHTGTARTCAIFFGTGGPVMPATREGVVMCDP